MKKQIVIIHYNTPELTEATVFSIRKHGGMEYAITIFDNSDKLPWRAKLPGVKVVDNTKGQVINFDKELAKYPNKNRVIGCAKGNEFGSVKHIMTVDKLWDLFLDGFVLVESDTLIKKSIDEFFNPEYSVVAYIQAHQPNNKFGVGRVLPMLCWFNVPKFRAENVRYFDPERCWALRADPNDRRNWYDTGASLLEDILTHRPRLKGLHVDIRQFLEHYESGSWKNNNPNAHRVWLDRWRSLWQPTPQIRGEKKVAVCAIGRLENRYAVEWVEHYRKLGVDKLFVYDNYFGNEERLADVLQPYIESGLVELTDIHDMPKYQCRAYEDCYRRHGNEYAWIGFFDMDEFLRYNGHKKLPTVLQQYTKGNVLMVNWRTMTDNGLTHYDDRPLAVRFTEPMPNDRCVKEKDIPENRYAKCFVRGGLGDIRFGCNPHLPENVAGVINTRGEDIPRCSILPDIDHSVMHLDHYWTKTAEEWREKIARGSCSGHPDETRYLSEGTRFFFAVNKRTKEKEKILAKGE